VGQFENLPFDESSFDVVVASEVLEHLDDEQREKSLRQVQRVLKPGGIFIGTVPHNEHLKDNLAVCPNCAHKFHRWGHVKSYNPKSLEQELSGHFSYVKTYVRAFVTLKRSFVGIIKSIIRWVLGLMGSPMSKPNIYFQAQKK
jgi:ubiquinone/menaquinone biosynthesis C-methylase UbiE